MKRCFFCNEEIPEDYDIRVTLEDGTDESSCIPCAIAEYDLPLFLGEMYFTLAYDGDEALERINKWRLDALQTDASEGENENLSN